jgi:hypothetical protein
VAKTGQELFGERRRLGGEGQIWSRADLEDAIDEEDAHDANDGEGAPGQLVGREAPMLERAVEEESDIPR